MGCGTSPDWLPASRGCSPELGRVQPLEEFGDAPRLQRTLATCVRIKKFLPINGTEVRIENSWIQLGSLLLTILADGTFRADLDR
jgi:hypothetical protein